MMLTLCRVVLIGAILIATQCFALCSSQEPPQTQHAQQSNSPANATREHQITKSLWQRLSIIWDRTWDDPVAFYTFILSIFTALLAIVSFTQIRFLIRSDETARITAEATAKTARAVIGVQLPIIGAKPDNLGHGDSINGAVRTEECSVYAVTLSNLGATKAFPKEILYGWWIGDSLPSEPKYEFSDKFSINSILTPEATITQTLTMTKTLKEGQWSDICRGNRLWFYCSILYTDFMDESHSHGFCWRWADIDMGGGWRADATPTYNKKT